MNDHRENVEDLEESRSPPNGRSVTVTDATHPRFRRRMVRCTEEGHTSFPLNTIKKHFTDNKHQPITTACVYCGHSNVYEYYETSNAKIKKHYHECASHPMDEDHAESSPRLAVTPVDTEAQQYHETSDAESSGIGTGYCSMVSVFNGCEENGHSTTGSPSKSPSSETTLE